MARRVVDWHLAERGRVPFRAVNRRGLPDYDPGMQRHHLLPRQLLSQSGFRRLFDAIGRECVGFDDFRSNGLLLPACDRAAISIGLPLHRGPHRDYNAMVMDRIGVIEASWSALRLRSSETARNQAVMRLRLVQRALRRRLLNPNGRRITLNRMDPLGRSIDFTDLDAMADALWGETEAT